MTLSFHDGFVSGDASFRAVLLALVEHGGVESMVGPPSARVVIVKSFSGRNTLSVSACSRVLVQRFTLFESTVGEFVSELARQAPLLVDACGNIPNTQLVTIPQV